MKNNMPVMTLEKAYCEGGPIGKLRRNPGKNNLHHLLQP
jgi:hypothetical protein